MSTNPCGDILKTQLDALKRQDRKMSLRKFARMLNIPASTLSQVINGSRNLGIRTALRISQELSLNEDLHHLFISSVLERPFKLPDSSNVKKSSARTCPPRGTWLHHAILELNSLTNSQMSPIWIARKFSITFAEARSALQDVHEWGLISKDAGSTPHDRPKDIIINSDTKRSKIFHSNLLGKASQSLEWFGSTDRDTSALIVAVKRSQIKYARKKIREFQMSMLKHLSKDLENDEIYVLQVNLFPLSSCEGGDSRSKS